MMVKGSRDESPEQRRATRAEQKLNDEGRRTVIDVPLYLGEVRAFYQPPGVCTDG